MDKKKNEFWEYNSKTENAYDDSGKITTVRNYVWEKSKSDWQINSEQNNTYFAGDSVLEIKQIWDGSRWENSNRSLSHFNAKGDLIKQDGEKWNATLSIWEPEKRIEFIYGKDEKLQRKESSDFDTTNSCFFVNLKEEFIYGEERVIQNSFVYRNSMDGPFYNSSRYKYEYDEDGDLLKKIHESWGYEWYPECSQAWTEDWNEGITEDWYVRGTDAYNYEWLFIDVKETLYDCPAPYVVIKDGQACVKNITGNPAVTLYTASGMMLETLTTTGEACFTLSQRGIYLIWIDEKQSAATLKLSY